MMTTRPWRTTRTLLTEQIDPEGRKWVMRDDISASGEHLVVPDITTAVAARTRDHAALLAKIGALATTCGDDAARELDDGLSDFEVAWHLEMIARLLDMARTLEPSYGVLVHTPGAAAADGGPPPLPEWPPRRVLRLRGRRILAALAGAFVAGVAVRPLVSRLA